MAICHESSYATKGSPFFPWGRSYVKAHGVMFRRNPPPPVCVCVGSHCSKELKSLVMKHRGAFAPPEHGHDTGMARHYVSEGRSTTGAARVRPTGGWWVRAHLEMWAASAHMEWY